MLVKVMEQREKEKIMTRANKLMDKTVYAVSDKTGSMMLTVWGEDVLVLDTWYNFTGVSVRLCNDKVLLTTTPLSTFSIADDAGAASPAVENDVQHTVGEIVQVEVTFSYLCPQRHALLNVNTSTLMTRCEKCTKFCKNSKLSRVMKAILVVEDAEKKLV